MSRNALHTLKGARHLNRFLMKKKSLWLFFCLILETIVAGGTEDTNTTSYRAALIQFFTTRVVDVSQQVP